MKPGELNVIQGTRERTKVGELLVIGGTNEVAICVEEQGEGLFSKRLREGKVGKINIVGKLTEAEAKTYWKNKEIMALDKQRKV